MINDNEFLFWIRSNWGIKHNTYFCNFYCNHHRTPNGHKVRRKCFVCFCCIWRRGCFSSWTLPSNCRTWDSGSLCPSIRKPSRTRSAFLSGSHKSTVCLNDVCGCSAACCQSRCCCFRTGLYWNCSQIRFCRTNFRIQADHWSWGRKVDWHLKSAVSFWQFIVNSEESAFLTIICHGWRYESVRYSFRFLSVVLGICALNLDFLLIVGLFFILITVMYFGVLLPVPIETSLRLRSKFCTQRATHTIPNTVTNPPVNSFVLILTGFLAVLFVFLIFRIRSYPL